MWRAASPLTRRSQPATPTAMPTRQIRPGALGLLTPPCSVPWEPVRNDSARGPAGERRSVRHAARPRGAGSISRAARRVARRRRAGHSRDSESAVSPNVSRFDAPCHVAHVGRRVANTGGDARRSGAVIQPVALQSTAPPIPYYSSLVVIQPVALAARLCVTGQASRAAVRIVRYLRWR